MKKKILLFIMAVSLVLSSESIYCVASDIPTSGTITSVTELTTDTGTQHIGTISGLNGYAYCTDDGKPFPSKGVSGNLTLVTEQSSEKMKTAVKIMYYYAFANKSQYTTVQSSIKRLRLALDYNMHDGFSNDYWSKSVKEDALAIYKAAKSKSFPKDSGFTCYMFSPGNNEYQRLFVWNYVPKGKVSVIKKAICDCDEIIKEFPNMCCIKGAKYEVYVSKDDAENKKNTVARLVTDESGNTDKVELDAGTYYVREVSAPEGFIIDRSVHEVSVKSGETTIVESSDKLIAAPVGVVLKKKGTDSNYLNAEADMSGAVFEVKMYDVMTDKKEELKDPVRTWRIVTGYNSKTEAYVACLGESYLDKSFDNDNLYKDADGNVILPRGTVTVQEISAPKGYAIDDKVRIYHTDISESNPNRAVFNEGLNPEISDRSLVPAVSTTARDANTENNYGISGETTVKDVVEYSGLWLGESYTVKGTLMDGSTEEPVKGKDGKIITATETFTVTKENSVISNANEASGHIELEFDLNTDVLNDGIVVVFEKLYWNSNEEGAKPVEIASHEDIKDSNQTVKFPLVKTTARDDLTGNHVGRPAENSVIKDAVEYRNLIAGNTYTVKGMLMNRDNGQPVTDDEGLAVTAEQTFTADRANGMLELEFNADTEKLNGGAVVIFEDLYSGDVKVAEHRDIGNTKQTVFYPEIAKVIYPETGDPALIYVYLTICGISLIGAVVFALRKKA